MWIAFGQQAGQRGDRGQGGKCGGVVEHEGRITLRNSRRSGRDCRQCAPSSYGLDVIADLQNRAQPARATAVHETQVTPVLAREKLKHGPGLAVRPR